MPNALQRREKDLYFSLINDGDIRGCFFLRGLDMGYKIPSFGLYVFEDETRKGYGEFAICKSFEILKENKFYEIRLKVHQNNTSAYNLYQKHGYVQTDFDVKSQSYLMHKQISD